MEERRTQGRKPWGHSSVVGREIEELANEARRGVTCEAVGDTGEYE